MTDIIAKAQGLLDGTTPGDWVAIPHDDWDNAKVIAPDDEPGVCEIATMFQEEHDLADAKLMAASKTHAQALAEESYEYAVQVWMGGRWIMMLTRDHGTSITHRGKWFEHKHEAEECAAKWNHDTPTRIVRQRRSPMEVIE